MSTLPLFFQPRESFLKTLLKRLGNTLRGTRKKSHNRRTMQAFLNIYDRRDRELHSLWYPDKSQHTPFHYPLPVRCSTKYSQAPDKTLDT